MPAINLRCALFLRAASVFLLVAIIAGCSAGSSGAQTPRSLTIGMDNTAVNTLLFIAESQGYFRQRGVDVTLKVYPSGLAAVNAVLKEEVDAAVSSEFVVVGRAFAGQPIRVWGSIDKFMHNYLIARKDHGVHAMGDLRGKKIGVPLQTAAEFYLGRFLDLNGLNIREVTPVNTAPADLRGAIEKGAVDAVVAWQPNASDIEASLGSAAISYPVQNNQPAYAVLVSSEAWTRENPALMRRFLQALVDAEGYYAGSPQQAVAVLKNHLSLDDARLEEILPEHQFLVSLDQSMVLAMEDEARWMIQNQMVAQQQVPHFSDYLSTQGLLEVRKESVNIIP